MMRERTCQRFIYERLQNQKFIYIFSVFGSTAFELYDFVKYIWFPPKNVSQ